MSSNPFFLDASLTTVFTIHAVCLPELLFCYCRLNASMNKQKKKKKKEKEPFFLVSSLTVCDLSRS